MDIKLTEMNDLLTFAHAFTVICNIGDMLAYPNNYLCKSSLRS